MTPTQARQWTLKEIIDWCEQEQKNCEEAQDRWVVINSSPEKYPGLPHQFQSETEVTIINTDGDLRHCKSLDCDSLHYGKDWWVHKDDLENRKHLDTDKYNALQSVIDKCNELMNSISVAA